MKREDRRRLQSKVALLTGAPAAIKGELMGFGGAAAALRADGCDARYMRLGVTSEQNWAQVVDAVMAAQGRLDILFNSTGVRRVTRGSAHGPKA